MTRQDTSPTGWEPIKASQLRQLSRWERAGITVGIAAASVGFAACGTSSTVSVIQSGHKVQEPATAYWRCVATAQDQSRAPETCEPLQSDSAWVKAHTETGIYAKVDGCATQAFIHHTSTEPCWAMLTSHCLPVVEGQPYAFPQADEQACEAWNKAQAVGR